MLRFTHTSSSTAASDTFPHVFELEIAESVRRTVELERKWRNAGGGGERERKREREREREGGVGT